MPSTSRVFTLFAVATLARCALAANSGVDLCSYFETHPVDPCLPGGKYDPLLQRCTGALAGSECYPCYSGPNCKTLDASPACMVTSGGGNPLVFQEYWETAGPSGHDQCTSSPVSYRQGYQNQGNSPPVATIEDTICELHKVVGNADCTGHEVVLGFGSTQVMAAALYAKATAVAMSGSTASVATQTPYYMHYPYQANVTMVPSLTGGYKVGAAFDAGASVTSTSTIQIVTRPNNPNGEMRTATAPDDQAIYDLAYNWPQFTSQYNQGLNKSLMIFTASKMAGMAGARFGWALVKDPLVAALMRDYITDQTLGLEIGSQLRVLDVMQHLIAAGPTGGMFEFATAKMSARWVTVRSIFNSTSRITLENTCAPSEPRCGAYAWVKCPTGVNCFNLFHAAGLTGVPGPMFGGSMEHLRFTLMMRSVEMDLAFDRMRAVVGSAIPSLDRHPELRVDARLGAHTRVRGC